MEGDEALPDLQEAAEEVLRGCGGRGEEGEGGEEGRIGVEE